MTLAAAGFLSSASAQDAESGSLLELRRSIWSHPTALAQQCDGLRFRLRLPMISGWDFSQRFRSGRRESARRVLDDHHTSFVPSRFLQRLRRNCFRPTKCPWARLRRHDFRFTAGREKTIAFRRSHRHRHLSDICLIICPPSALSSWRRDSVDQPVLDCVIGKVRVRFHSHFFRTRVRYVLTVLTDRCSSSAIFETAAPPQACRISGIRAARALRGAAGLHRRTRHRPGSAPAPG